MQNPGGRRIFGNGIISSSGETLHSLTDQVEKRRFGPELTARQPYDIRQFQDVLWVVDSLDQLEADFARWAKSRGLL